MQAPSNTAPVRSSAPVPAAPTATELVTRPEPGLARGLREAPAWFFWVILALLLLGTVAYILRRIGILLLPSERAAATPPSLKSRR